MVWDLFIYTVTAREVNLCGERGNPTAGRKSCVCGLGMPRKAGANAGGILWING